MKRIIIILLALAAIIPVAAQQREVAVSPDSTLQTIEYFAAADAWSGNFVGKYWEEEKKEQIARWLFSRELDAEGNPEGIGLSLWRVNLGAGTLEQEDCDIEPYQRRAESFIGADGKYDWSKCAGQFYWMNQAKDLGCDNLLLFSNSPLVQWTRNGKGYSSSITEANIRPDCYDDYAGYMADVAGHLKSEGLNVSWISPINEPQGLWNKPTQEGTPWRKSEMVKMIKALDSALTARDGLDNVKIEVGETAWVAANYGPDSYLRRRFGSDDDAPDDIIHSFFDPASKHYIGDLTHVPASIGGHTYHNHHKNAEMVEVRSKIKDECRKYGISYHQTEWCLLKYSEEEMRTADGFTEDWNHDTDGGDIQAGLLLGRLVYTDFLHAGAEGWGFWKGMEVNGSHSLISLQTDRLEEGGTASPNKIMWALGNYSFFIRPGYRMIQMTGADDLNTLAGTAYIAPDKSRIILVFVNSGFAEESAKISLPAEYQRKVSGIFLYLTDQGNDLKLIGSSRRRLECRIAPRSLTTAVIDLK